MQKFEKWTEIYTRLLADEKQHTLEPKDLETLSLAAYLIGKDIESFRALEEAHQRYLSVDESNKAVRCAFWLGLMLMNAGEKARSNGWFARGERILSERENANSAEKGMFLIPQALGALSCGLAPKAQEIFEKVAATGVQFHDHDLIALGRLGQGQSLVHQGDVARGIKLLDETMITVETEAVFPIVYGIAYCAVIESCRMVWDLERSLEWTSALTRWCDAQPDIVPFRGECLVRRAEIFQFHGEWDQALEKTTDACELLLQARSEKAAGEAYYRRGELLRLTGDFDQAENCYKEAAKRGRKPQPGLALLRLAQGSTDVAETSIHGSLMETNDRRKRAELLPAAIAIKIVAGRTDKATSDAEELCRIASDFNVPYLLAVCAHSQGAVLLARREIQPALQRLQKALKFWNTLNLPYESACTTELKALAYQELKENDNSTAELSAAKWIFEQLGAIPDLERINRLLNNDSDHETHGLTLRELEVLRLIASGKTNKTIARELFISDRTVDRHVSNIFNKLDVSSRVEATTFALTNKLMKEGG